MLVSLKYKFNFRFLNTMDPHRKGLPALSHSGSMGPQVDHHHSVPYLEVPTATAPGWWSILAGTGMPRRNSVGFSENYVSDTAPPFCLDEDSNPPTLGTRYFLRSEKKIPYIIFPSINAETYLIFKYLIFWKMACSYFAFYLASF